MDRPMFSCVDIFVAQAKLAGFVGDGGERVDSKYTVMI